MCTQSPCLLSFNRLNLDKIQIFFNLLIFLIFERKLNPKIIFSKKNLIHYKKKMRKYFIVKIFNCLIDIGKNNQ